MVHSVADAPNKPGVSVLKAYAKSINVAVETITDYLDKEGLPEPSFGPRGPNVTIPPTAPLSVLEARQQLIASAAAIQKLAAEPAEYLPNLAIHYQILSCLRWLTHFDIFSAIPLDASTSYDELARKANVPEQRLKSVIRMAITSNLFCEPKTNEVAHNAVSSLFVTKPGFLDWAKFMVRYSAPTAAAFADATQRWGNTVEKNETAFNAAFATERPFFDYFAQSSDLAGVFASYMKSVQGSPGTSLTHLVTGFDWESLGEATVVDIGGSTCSSSIALANAFSRLKFVVQDLPDTIQNASNVLSKYPESIHSRITVEAYDFFSPQPRHGADIYLLRMILHDWPANISVTILQNQLDALKANPHSRLLIMDTVLPTPGGSSISVVEEALLRVRDLTMIQTFNSNERELSGFIDLFKQVQDSDGYLFLKGTVTPPGSMMSVMEVGYQPHGR